jgi:prepilin-type N-terminal cleavage/methylation domain-containing protein
MILFSVYKPEHKHTTGRRAFTALEMLVAVTVFAMLFYGVFQLQNSALTTFNIGYWKAETQRKLVNGLKRVRDNVEKATYPSMIFEDGTMIYGATPPTIFAYQKPSDDANNGGIAGLENYYLRYKPCPGNAPITVPTNGPIISFYKCTPNIKSQLMAKSEVATFTNMGGTQIPVQIIWRGPNANSNHPAIQYKEGNNDAFDIIPYVTEVLITARDIKPPGVQGANGHYSIYNVHAVINLKITLSSATDGRVKRAAGNDANIIVNDEIKARCNVRAVGNL